MKKFKIDTKLCLENLCSDTCIWVSNTVLSRKIRDKWPLYCNVYCIVGIRHGTMHYNKNKTSKINNLGRELNIKRGILIGHNHQVQIRHIFKIIS